MNHAPCGIVTFLDTGTIVEVNATLLNLLGYTLDELEGQKFETLLTISGRIFYQTHFFPLLTLHGKAEEIFLTLRAKSKQEFPVLVNAVRRQHNDQYLSTCVLMVVNQRQKYEEEILLAKRAAENALRSNQELIAAKQELEQQTQELDRIIGQLEQKNREHLRVTQILFHDLWEPLRRIYNFTDLLAQEVGEAMTTQQQHFFSRIHAASTHLEELLRSLQTYMAVDIVTEKLTQVDLNEALARAQESVGLKERECEIASTLLPSIDGYHDLVVMLFSQLIDNSIKFRRPDVAPRIRIRHSLLQQNLYQRHHKKYRYVDFVKITFEDNSLGFDSQYATSIFELLKKLDADTAGTGVGLAICKKIVEKHFGTITARSEVGQGVCMTLLLPLRQQAFFRLPLQAETEKSPPTEPSQSNPPAQALSERDLSRYV